jgi:hypothetical protein
VVYVSRFYGDRLLRRLRRDAAALVMAGGRLPDSGAWVEGLRPPFARLGPDEWRWQVMTADGWTNVGSRWPVSLVMNAPHLYFYSADQGVNVNVEIGAP